MSFFDRITETEDKPDYFDRNGKWLYPLTGSFVLMAASMTISMLQQTPGGEIDLFIPEGLIALFALLGIFMAGFGVAVTDTLSAAIMRCVLTVAVFGLVAYVLSTTDAEDLFRYWFSLLIATGFFFITFKTRR
jgi:peptidoglycan/LPS O-acetylase OafA/YrhL